MSSTIFISNSKCDGCHWDGLGLMYTDPYETPILFQCLLCVPEQFEEIYLEDQKGETCLPQDEKSSII